MFTASQFVSTLVASAVVAISALVFLASGAQVLPFAEAQRPVSSVPTERDVPAAAPIAGQPAAKIIIEPPKPGPLERGVAIIQFRTENLQIVPVFGPDAAAVSPRIGHLHVTVDDTPWHWGHTTADPIIVADLSPGPHKILIELADANHKVLAQEVVKFEVLKRSP